MSNDVITDMPEAAATPSVKSKVLYTKFIDWRSLKFIQQDDFKEWTPEARAKLKHSVLSNEFTQPFYVWQDAADQEIYCLDGKHRTLILEELIAEGYDIPEKLPATFIDCKDKKEAAKLVLAYSSVYAKITTGGFQSFLEEYGIDENDIMLSIDIPGLELPEVPDIPFDAFADDGIGVKNQYGVIVMCKNEADQHVIFEELSAQGYECKVVVT